MSCTNTSNPSVTVKAKNDQAEIITFDVVARLDSKIDIEYYQNGGILHTVLRNILMS